MPRQYSREVYRCPACHVNLLLQLQLYSTCLKPLLLTLLRLLFVLAVSSLLEIPAAARRSAASKEQASST